MMSKRYNNVWLCKNGMLRYLELICKMDCFWTTWNVDPTLDFVRSMPLKVCVKAFENIII